MPYAAIARHTRKAKSFLASFFSVQFLAVTAIYAGAGMFSQEGLLTSAIFLPVVALGSALGFWAFRRVSNRLYRQVVGIMLLAAAVTLWVQA